MVSTEAAGPRADQPAAAGQGYQIFLFHHTHWDREWWGTFQEFRFRLVELIDSLLDALDHDPEFRTFLLDGQTIVLRDYLEIRPENRERLVRYIRGGRIQCGPWYILPDEYLVSGEAHVRNLLLGRRVAGDLGVPILSAGYMPDTFGHVAQMPQILRGFGIDNAFVWRGRGGAPDTVKQEFLWQSPDGSAVLAHWFPNSYYQMPFLHFDDPGRPYGDKLGRIYRMIGDFSSRATSGVLLMPYGGDHRPIDRNLPRKIAEANATLGPLGHIEWSTVEEYLAAVRDKNPILETVRGELRAFGVEHPHVLPGVLSTRLYLKRLNFQGQTWLERYAEPLSARAWLHGGRYDGGFLWKAWELLVQNHPHDSICGCSIDQVHREMIPRFDQARQIAQIVTQQAVQHLNRRINTLDYAGADRLLVVHNPLPWQRTGWASVWLERAAISPRTHALLDSHGEEIPFQARDVEGLQPTFEGWRWTEVGFVAHAVPGLGHQTYQLVKREAPLDPKRLYFTAVQPTAALKGSQAANDLSLGANILENGWLRVEVDPRTGTLSITDKSSGFVYTGLNAFEDGGDGGDEYNYSAPLNDTLLLSTDGARVHVSVAQAGYARATLRVDLDWVLPSELSRDRLSRSSDYIPTRISSYVSLAADSPTVDITTDWENRTKDHRLRALFPLGAPVSSSHAEGHFNVTDRPVRVVNPGRGWPEPYVPTMPQQGWVSVDDGNRGLTVANRGLPEYEVLDDGQGTVALTILRAVGWASREDLLSRVGGAGPDVPVPDAQCLGPNRVSYSIIPHAGNWLASRAYLPATEYLVPFYGSSTDVHGGDQEPDAGSVDLTGEHTLMLSACKKSERDDVLILRVWNLASEATEAVVTLGCRPCDVRLVDLKEEAIGERTMPISEDGTFTLRVEGSKIVTVAIRFPGRDAPETAGFPGGAD